MVCEAYFEGDTVIHRLDPRVRVVTAVVFSAVVALSGRLEVAGVGVLLALLGAVSARLPATAVLRRLTAVNVFIVLLALLLPFSVEGRSILKLGSYSYTIEGLRKVALIALKANAVVLGFTVLLGTMEITSLGHALSHLRVPAKFSHLLLFTVRYIEVLRHEYLRLARAMRVRRFRPGVNPHTYRSLGYLVGMLVVRSFDRSERIISAMKCRGFRGKFYLLKHFRMSALDGIFCAGAVIVTLALLWVELL